MAEQNPSDLLNRIEKGFMKSPYRIVRRQSTDYLEQGDDLLTRLNALTRRGVAHELRLAVACKEPTYNIKELQKGLGWIAQNVVGLENIEPESSNFFYFADQDEKQPARLHIGHITGREVLGHLQVEADFLPNDWLQGSTLGVTWDEASRLEVASHIRVNLFPDTAMATLYANAPGAVAPRITQGEHLQALRRSAR